MPPKLRTAKKQIALTSNPPQHTFENDPNHRAFLSRSLSKSDTELSALNKLNTSLKELKEYIIEHFGMDVLLDVGEGYISLSSYQRRNDAAGDNTAEDSEEKYERFIDEIVLKNSPMAAPIILPLTAKTEPDNEIEEKVEEIKTHDKDMAGEEKETEITADATDADGQPSKDTTTASTSSSTDYSKLMEDPTFKAVIKNFILRLKLRRKLLNRLSRRLLRLSHAMDGKLNKISPPMLPKFGTSSEKITNDLKDRVTEWNKDFESKEGVLNKLWTRKEELRKQMNMLKLAEEEANKYKTKVEESKESLDNEEATGNGESREENKTQEPDNVKSSANNTEDKQKVSEDGTAEKEEQKIDGDDTAMEDAQKIDGDDTAMDDAVDQTDDVEMKNETMENEQKKENKNESEGEAIKKPDPPEAEKKLQAEEEEEKPDPPETEENNQTEEKEEKYATRITSSPIDSIPFLLNTEHQQDMEKLIEYDIDYAKKHIIDFSNSTILKTTTALTKLELAALDKDEDDFDEIENMNKRHGIGAVSKYMTKKEKEMEWKRWQTEFLSKIPDQPTFKELGVENRVFFAEERRKEVKLKKENEMKGNVEEEGEDGEMKEESSLEDSEQKDKKRESKKRGRGEEEDEANENEDETDEDEKEDLEKDKKKEKEVELPILKRKRISLDPVPSFYQQDYSRIIMIQSATLSSALSTNIRDTYLQCKNEYDQIFKRSQDLQSRKSALESQLSKVTYDYRIRLGNVNNNIAIAKAKWEANRKASNAQKLQRMRMESQMSGKPPPAVAVMEAMTMTEDQKVKRKVAASFDQNVIKTYPHENAVGTQHLSAALHGTTPGSTRHEVAASMAHCVDIAMKRAQSGWIQESIMQEVKCGEQYPPFQSTESTSPDHIIMNQNGESFTAIKNRLTTEMSKTKLQLEASEASRAKAWGRLNKAQSSMDSRSSSNAPVQSYRAYQRPKTHSRQTAAPQNYSNARHRPTYPQPTSMTMANNPAVASAAAAAAAVKANMNIGLAQGGSSQSKYSIEKVRARMYSDGSVLPVSMPKRGKDGFFIRPAGRQRKGMDWDAVNGKWVPQGTLPHGR